MSLPELNNYLDLEASSVRLPFILIGIVVSLIVILLWKTKLPDIKEEENESDKDGSILKEKNLVLGVVAQFFYVGAQVCVSSFFIRFSERVAGIEEKSAAYFLSGALLGFMLGRFVGTALMRLISPAKLLALYSILNILLLITAAFVTGKTAVYALIGVEFFMSIMFPTIFSLAILGLGSKTKQGSSLLIMSIVGGAIFPVIMGAVSDASNIQKAYLVPASCFFIIFYFAIKNLNAGKITLSTSH